MAGKKAPWDKDEKLAPGDSTRFVGGPQKPSDMDQSAVLLVDSNRAFIAVTRGPGKGKQMQIANDRIVLGREKPADMVVDDKAASRRHAMVYKKGDKWYLKDLDSTNGTWLDGPLKGTERILWDGDVFKIGEWEFTFSDPRAKKK